MSDSINFGFVNGVTVNANYIVGGWYKSGCGIIADDSVNNASITNNIVWNTFNCGIGVASGKNHTVSGNKVLILQPSTPYAAGIVVEGSDYSPAPCNTISITGNSSYAIQSGGYVQSYYNDGYCSSVTLTSNTWGQAAYNMLYPLPSTNPPPPHSPEAFQLRRAVALLEQRSGECLSRRALIARGAHLAFAEQRRKLRGGPAGVAREEAARSGAESGVQDRARPKGVAHAYISRAIAIRSADGSSKPDGLRALRLRLEPAWSQAGAHGRGPRCDVEGRAAGLAPRALLFAARSPMRGEENSSDPARKHLSITRLLECPCCRCPLSG